jgi:hypothetical protein
MNRIKTEYWFYFFFHLNYSKEVSELLICVELMDASLDRFYQTMHSLEKITYEDLDHVLCRLTHNVKIKYIHL